MPDFDRYFQEQQAQTALEEMAGHSRANIFRVAIYQSLRAPGPSPDLTALGESVDYCADQIATTADCRVSRGEYQQEELWPATLPLGRDTAARGHKYMTRNVDGSVPLLGTSCGSPSGIPFAFADPGRTLELLDPYDRKHANQTMLIVGQSGKGKTMAANVILGRCLAMGARVFGIDRAGHYGLLTRLVPGGREIDIGADDSPWAINPWDVPDPANVGLQKVTFLKSLHGLMMGADGLTVTERAQLDTAIRQVYAWAANRRLKPRESMLRAALLERAETEREADNPELASMLRHLAERLSEFCDEGSYAYLLDRDTNVPADAPVIVFDTRRCPTELLQLVMFMIVEYVREAAIAHRETAQALTSRPDAPMFAGRSVLVIDEAWHMVSRRETGEYANDLARRARHIGLFLIVISQQMSDFDGEYGRALLRNSTLQLLLAQHPHELPRLKEALDLTDQEAAIVAQLRTVKGQYAQMLWINGERGRAKVSLPVGPLEYWMYTSDPLRDAPAREAAIDRHSGDVWAAIHELATGCERRCSMTSRRRRWALLIATGAGTISVFAFVVLPAVLVSTINACSSGPTVPAGNGAWLATAYGPPWGGIQGDGVTATGINLTAGPPMLEVAVDPSVIPLRSFVHVEPNPFDTLGRLLRGRHRRRDHGPARGHLRLARARRPGRLGERGRSPSPRRPTPAPATRSSRCRRRRCFPGQPMRLGGRLSEPVRARHGDRARADRHGRRLHRERPDRRAGRRDRHLLAGRGRRVGAVLLLGRPRRRGRVPARRWPRPGPLRVRDRGDHPGGSGGPADLRRSAGRDVHGVHRDRLGDGHRRSAHGRRARAGVRQRRRRLSLHMVRAEHEPADRRDRADRPGCSSPAGWRGVDAELGVPEPILATALGLALTGCGISDPYTTSQRTSSTVESNHKASVPDDDGPSPPHTTATPDAAAPSPQAALARYAALYVNWTAATLCVGPATAGIAVDRPGARPGAGGGQRTPHRPWPGTPCPTPGAWWRSPRAGERSAAAGPSSPSSRRTDTGPTRACRRRAMSPGRRCARVPGAGWCPAGTRGAERVTACVRDDRGAGSRRVRCRRRRRTRTVVRHARRAGCRDLRAVRRRRGQHARLHARGGRGRTLHPACVRVRDQWDHRRPGAVCARAARSVPESGSQPAGDWHAAVRAGREFARTGPRSRLATRAGRTLQPRRRGAYPQRGTGGRLGWSCSTAGPPTTTSTAWHCRRPATCSG